MCAQEREYHRLVAEREKRKSRVLRMGPTSRIRSSIAYNQYVAQYESKVSCESSCDQPFEPPSCKQHVRTQKGCTSHWIENDFFSRSKNVFYTKLRVFHVFKTLKIRFLFTGLVHTAHTAHPSPFLLGNIYSRCTYAPWSKTGPATEDLDGEDNDNNTLLSIEV